MAKTLLRIDSDCHVTEADQGLQKALDADTRYRTHWGAAQDGVLYRELYRNKGDPSRARESLGKAIEKFAECGADGWVRMTEEKLAQL